MNFDNLMNKEKAISELAKYDHSFLKPETATAITEPFGFKPETSLHADTRSHHKGLTLSGINPKTGKEFVEGEEVEGIEAHVLAIQICNHEKVKYAEMFGIGSQLRACCDALSKSLTK